MRRRLVVRSFNQMGLTCFEPRGAFYAFPVPQIHRDDEPGVLHKAAGSKSTSPSSLGVPLDVRRGYARVFYALLGGASAGGGTRRNPGVLERNGIKRRTVRRKRKWQL